MLKAQFEAKEQESIELTTRITNYYHNITLGLLDMVEALALSFLTTTDEELAKIRAAEVTRLFSEGKKRFLMYSRWLYILEQDPFIQDWINMVEPIQLESFATQEEWIDFFNSLPI